MEKKNIDNIPDYSVYHLHELEVALKNVDEITNPNEAEEIRGYIKAGGYKYPMLGNTSIETISGPVIMKVSFVNAKYKKLLVLMLGLLLFINLSTIVFAHNLVALIPATFQLFILTLIYQNHKYTRFLIKMWSGMAIVSGLSILLGMLLSDNFLVLDFIWGLIVFTVGLSFLLLANKYVHLVYANSNQSFKRDWLKPAP